ncbi:4-coumarate--CoA ligase-like 7 [Neofusicoccum parvum]|uniref:4-coumarate--CoA ligase-like 7 n=1 Tax=Neofusicoccum parvum TaxID=310453 RepID=A0ACB5SN69_9PEZI|nr:4-coumarate--CoA ligase-like 7 [Neofusicoccum parvum]
MIYRSPTALEYPKDATVTDVFLYSNPNNTPSDKPAIIDGPTGEIVFTYESLRVAVKKFARYLQSEAGVKPGTVVAILSTTKNYFPVAVHGVLAVGAVVSAFNPLYQPKEIAHALRLAKPTHIIVEDTLLPALQTGLSLAALPTPPTTHIWSDTPSYTAPAPHHTLSIPHILSTTPPTYHPPPTAPTSLALIAFSSGTSGHVKGVALPHTSLVANIHQQRAALPSLFASPTAVTALAVPFFHILGLAGFCCQYLAAGIPVVVFRRFDAAALLAAVARHRVTHLNVVPPLALALLRAEPEAVGGDLACLRCLVNAAAPLKQPLADALARRFGVVVTQWYGMTEAAPSLASQAEEEVGVRHTVGRLLPGVEARVVGEEGEECGVGVSGELVVRGPNMMAGYVREDGGEEDGARDAEGWFRTGDIGYFDEKGYLFLVDRAKEMIKVKGHQVAPAELETILLGHPKVADAAVCGVYVDAEASEFPVAYVALHAGESARGRKEMVDLRQDIRKHVDGQVAHYKRLKGGVHVLDTIPRNPSGKILRRLLPANLAKAADINKSRVSKL